MTDFYVASGIPASHSSGASATVRTEFAAIQAAMGKLAGYTGNGSKFLRVNAAGTAYEALTVADALAALAPNSAALAAAVSDETGSGALVFATSPTLVTPLLGTPTSGVLTNCTGTAAGLTAGNVTTNANLTGDVTSAGNAATVIKINGTSLAALGTGILKNTTATGVPSIAVAGDFPTLNQNTTGSAASVTTTATVTGAISSSSRTAGIGYASGAGGEVTQLTSKSTGVTLNALCGRITTHSESLPAGQIISFVVTNSSSLLAGHQIVITHNSGGSPGSYTITAGPTGFAGEFIIYIRNNTAGALAQALVLDFMCLVRPVS